MRRQVPEDVAVVVDSPNTGGSTAGSVSFMEYLRVAADAHEDLDIERRSGLLRDVDPTGILDLPSGWF